jgi:hypothetical protein
MTTTVQPMKALPLRTGERLAILRAAVDRQSGEWTPGRLKRLYHHDARLTHILRRTMRHDLARLHAEGVLDLHETPGRRYYTRSDGPRYDVAG